MKSNIFTFKSHAAKKKGTEQNLYEIIIGWRLNEL